MIAKGRLLLAAACIVSASPTSTAQSLDPLEDGLELVVSTTASSTTLGPQFTFIDPWVGIDDQGRVALSGRSSATGGDSAGWIIGDAPVASPTTFFGGGRVFSGACIGNAAQTAITGFRDRLSSPNLTYLVRTWDENGQFSIVASSPSSFDSAQSWLDVSSSGLLAYSSIGSGANPVRLSVGDGSFGTTLDTFPSGTQVRPSISDNGFVVARDEVGAIRRYPISGGASQLVVSGVGATTGVDSQPGIDQTGGVVAYMGDNGNGLALNLWVDGLVSQQTVELVGPQSGIAVQSGHRCAVQTSGSLGGEFVGVVAFSAIEDGVAGVYLQTFRVDQVVQGPLETITVESSEPKLVVQSGQSVDGEVVEGWFLRDCLNKRGDMAFRVNLSGGGIAVLRSLTSLERPSAAPAMFRKFKQNDPEWSAQCLIPDDADCQCAKGSKSAVIGTFGGYGCVLSCIATGIDAFLDGTGSSAPQVDPVFVRDAALLYGFITQCGGVTLERAWVPTIVDNGEYLGFRTQRQAGSSLEDVVAELEAGRPVILGVPSASLNVSNNNPAKVQGGRLHYVLAYAFDRDAGVGTSQGILINDPGFKGEQLYNVLGSPQPLPGFVPGFNSSGTSGDSVVHVTLHDYFAGLSRFAESNMGVDIYGAWGSDPIRDDARIRDWFDDGVLYLTSTPELIYGSSVTVSSDVRKKLITFMSSEPVPLGAPIGNPSDTVLRIASPIEVRVTSPEVPGVTLASDASVALPGDVVLEKNFEPVPLDPDGLGEQEEFGDTQPYTVVLPGSFALASLDVTVIGTGDGVYSLLLSEPFLGAQLSPEVTGDISVGQQVAAQLSTGGTPCAGNPIGSILLQSGTPAVGQSFSIALDSVLGTQAPGSTTLLAISRDTATSGPCGISLPGYGMAGNGSAGELLLDLSPASLIPPLLAGATWMSSASPAIYGITVPSDPGLIGDSFFFQGLIIDGSGGSTAPLGLTGRIALTVQ